jgi:hypothetical protein
MALWKKLALAGVLATVGGCLTLRLLWPADPVPQGTPTTAPEGPGWVNLLDDEHAGGWKNITDDKDIFEISDGMLHIYGKSIYPLRYVAYTPEPFGDFDLHVEFKVAPGANSGVFLRSQPNDPVSRGFEIQVLDDHGKPPSKNSSGSIYDVVSPMYNMARPPGEWNSYDIHLRGQEIEVFANGWRIIHTDLSKMTEPYGKFEIAYADLPLEGLLAFQDHGGEVWYRNVYIRRVEAPERDGSSTP